MFDFFVAFAIDFMHFGSVKPMSGTGPVPWHTRT